MLIAHGWAVLQSSRIKYANPNPDEWFILDEESKKADETLWRNFRLWMKENEDPFMVWQLTERLNNEHGLLQFAVSRNHRGSSLWEMLRWLANNSDGTYGIVFVHDDEDIAENKDYGRGDNDYSNRFRVWRVLKGELLEFDDPFLSPIVPTILPNFEA